MHITGTANCLRQWGEGEEQGQVGERQGIANILTNVVTDANAAAARRPAETKNAKLNILKATEGNCRDDGG